MPSNKRNTINTPAPIMTPIAQLGTRYLMIVSLSFSSLSRDVVDGVICVVVKESSTTEIYEDRIFYKCLLISIRYRDERLLCAIRHYWYLMIVSLSFSSLSRDVVDLVKWMVVDTSSTIRVFRDVERVILFILYIVLNENAISLKSPYIS